MALSCVNDPEVENTVPVFGDVSSADVTAQTARLTAQFQSVDPKSIGTGSCHFFLSKNVEMKEARDIVAVYDGAKSFSAAVDGLDPETMFYFQPVVSNGDARLTGRVAAFTTLAAALPPAPATPPSFLYLVNTRNEDGDAAFQAKMQPSTGYEILVVGLCYGTAASPVEAGDKVISALAEDNTVSFALTSLTPETHYYFRAYAKVFSEENGQETVYSEEVDLTTPAHSAPNPTAWIEFADPYAREACIARYDTDSDGGVSYEEAAAALSLDNLFADYKNVESFDEIQYFTSATTCVNAFKGTKIKHLTIPSHFTDIGTTAAFAGCTQLEDIVLPSAPTEIYYQMFSGCSSLVSIAPLDALERIGRQAFWNCTSLDIAIPATVTEIDVEAFRNCTSMKHIVLSDITLKANAFKDCTGIETIELAGPVTCGYETNAPFAGASGAVLAHLDVPNDLFYGSAITAFTFDAGCKTLGHRSFAKTSALIGTVNLDGIETINTYAFNESAITGVHFSSSLISMGEGAFKQAALAGELRIPGSLQVVPYHGFDACNALTSLILEEGVKQIYIYAFYNTHLGYISLPTTMEEVYDTSLGEPTGELVVRSNLKSGCSLPVSELTTITVSEGVTELPGGIFAGATSLTTLNLPSTLQVIGQNSLSYMRNLPELILPASVTSIGADAFTYTGSDVEDSRLIVRCNIPDWNSNQKQRFENAFHVIIIEEGVTSIGQKGFVGSTVKSVQLPSTLKTIGIEAFASCWSLKDITIPKNVTQIGDYALGMLKTVHLKGKNPPVIGSNTFSTYYLETLYVPNSALASYQSQWTKWTTYLVGEKDD